MSEKAIILFFPQNSPDGYEAGYPWALLYLERMIRHLDIEIILIDERINKDYTEIIYQTKGRLLFAGVSSIVGPQIERGLIFTEKIKSITGAPVIWGGWFPTVFKEMLLNDGYADYICVGQGEIPFKTFTEKFIAGEDVSDIPGIGYKKNGVITINPHDKLVNPNAFPRIDLRLLDFNKLIDIIGKVPTGFRSVDYLASTGCPNSCGFCGVVQLYHRKWFAKNINDIIDDLKYFKETTAISHVIFSDENIFASKKFVIDFCNELIKSELNITWSGYAHIGYFLRNFTKKDIELVYKAGCRDIRLGSESGDQEVLDLVNKKIQVNDTLKILKLLKKFNIQNRIFLITCFPNNPEKDFWLTLNLVGKAILINPNLISKIRFFVPFANTALFDLGVEKGFVPPSSTYELMNFFAYKFTENYKAPWCKKDYSKDLDNFEKFYFLLANPHYYKKFPLKKRFFILLLNWFMYPIIFIRFKFNLMKFPIEAKLFKKFLK